MTPSTIHNKQHKAQDIVHPHYFLHNPQILEQSLKPKAMSKIESHPINYPQ